MLLELDVPLPAGATTAPPPTPDDIQKLVAAVPRYGIEILLPNQ